uniref:SAM domain-containing protein n=1 Tax=Knipowitschia caucasica TaxID=637954 RepID=A0AAV2LUB1_KNICA
MLLLLQQCSPSPAGAGPLERTCASIPIPTIIIKEPSTSSSGKSSQGSSMEIEPSTPEHPSLTSHVCGGLRPDDSGSAPNPFAAAIAGAVKDREKRLKAKKNSIAFQSIDMGDDDRDSGGDGFSTPTPRLRQSKSIDEGMFGSDERLRRILAPSASLQKNSITLGKPVGGGNMTDFSSPEPVMVREPLSTRTGQCPNFDSPASLPSPGKSHQRTNGTYLHPVTGKPLDPNSPLALALAARDRAMKEQNHPQGHTLSQVQTTKHEVQSLPPLQTGPKTDLNQPLFIDTKLRSGIETSFAEISSTSSAVGRGRGLRRQNTEQKYDSESAREREPKHQPVEERKSAPPEGSEAKATGLLMVHTTDTEDSNTPSELKDPNEPESQTHSRRRSVLLGESLDEPVKLPFRIPPPPLASVDIDEEFEFSDPLPPPLEFANSIDVPDDQTSAYAEILQQQRRNGALPPYHHHAPPPVPEHHRRIAHTATGNSATANSATGNTARGNSATGASTTGTSTTGNSAPAAGSLSEHESISAPVLAADSGIEEVDSRSSGDPQHLESTSNVSSISTLSSEGGFCESTLELHLLPERPPVPPKPKGKPVINRSSLYHDALIEEPLEVGELVRTPTQRSSRLWGEPELSSPPSADSTVMTELSSILQHMNRGHSATDALSSPQGTHNYPPRTVDDSGMLRSATSPTPPSSLPSHPHSPLLTEPAPHSPHSCTPSEASPITPLTPCSSLPASASPTLTECFSQGGYSLGSSRSPSPLTLLLASNRPFASKPVELWSKGDVADWLDSLNLGEHRDAFLDNEIEGAHLPSLQKEDLIDLGVTRVGHRMNIERALKMLQDR